MPDEAVEVRCPYCHSKDLSVIPSVVGSGVSSNVITYKCQMCRRTFSKTPPPENKKE